MNTAALPSASAPIATRFNPWPYGILAFFAVAITGTAALVYIATSNNNELVATDYYEQEIRFQQRIDQAKRTQPWEAKITVRHDAATGVLQVGLPSEHAATGATGEIQLYRPAGARADRTFPIQLDLTGSQAIPASELGPGRWKVRVRWKAGEETFYTERDLVIPTAGR